MSDLCSLMWTDILRKKFCRVIYEIKDTHTDKYIRRPLLGVIRIPHIFVRKFFSVEINFKSQPLRKRGGERESERDRQTDTLADRQTDRERDRERQRMKGTIILG